MRSAGEGAAVVQAAEEFEPGVARRGRPHPVGRVPPLAQRGPRRRQLGRRLPLSGLECFFPSLAVSMIRNDG